MPYSLRNELRSSNEYDFITTYQGFDTAERTFIKSCYVQDGTKYIQEFAGDDAKKELLENLFRRENQYSKSSAMKAEFVYQLMDTPAKLENLKKICLYYWNGNKNLGSINLSDYIAEFYQFKTKYDDYNKTKMLVFYLKKQTAVIRDYRVVLGLGAKLDRLTERYKRELSL